MTRHDLRKARKPLGSQGDVAERLGVSRSTIQKQEAGTDVFRPLYYFAVLGLATAERGGDASRPPDGGPESAAR